MRRLTLTPILALLLVFALASPVQAGDWVHGDVCKYRLPAGFQKQDLDSMTDGASVKKDLAQFNGMFGMHAEADFDLYTRTLAGERDAMLGVMGIRLKGVNAPRIDDSLKNLDQLEQMLQRAADDAPGVVEEFLVRRTRIGAGAEALEVVISAYDEEMGGLATARMAFAVDESAIVMVVFEGRAENAATDDLAWQGLLGTMSLEGRSPLIRFALKYGPYALGGLLLFVVISLLRKSGRSQQVVTRWPASDGGGVPSAPSGAGLSRAADGLPTYQEGTAPGGASRLPSGAGGGGTGPSLGGAAPSPPGIRTIPRAKTAPVGAGLGPGPGEPSPALGAAGSLAAGGGVGGAGGPPPLGEGLGPGAGEARPGAAPGEPSPALGAAGAPAPAYGTGAPLGGVPPGAPRPSTALHRPNQQIGPPPIPQSAPLGGPGAAPLPGSPAAPPLGGQPRPAGPLPTNVARRDPSQIQRDPPGSRGALEGVDFDKPPRGSDEPEDDAVPREPSGLKIKRNSDYS